MPSTDAIMIHRAANAEQATRQPMPPFYDPPLSNVEHCNRDASHNSAICTESDLHSCFSIHDTSAAFELPHLHSIRQH
jgi:hypothetical protein